MYRPCFLLVFIALSAENFQFHEKSAQSLQRKDERPRFNTEKRRNFRFLGKTRSEKQKTFDHLLNVKLEMCKECGSTGGPAASGGRVERDVRDSCPLRAQRNWHSAHTIPTSTVELDWHCPIQG